jgi:hypothetical protein
MSSLALMGFFGLAEGKRVMTTRPNNTRIWHAHYTTTVQCTDGSSLPANVRIYSPMNDVLHPDDTVAFIYARAHISASSTVVMDASHVVPVPGNALDDSYEDSVPNLPNPFVIALGHVSGKASHLPDGSRTFPIAVSEYVRDSTQLCAITYVHHLVLLYLFPTNQLR